MALLRGGFHITESRSARRRRFVQIRLPSLWTKYCCDNLIVWYRNTMPNLWRRNCGAQFNYHDIIKNSNKKNINVLPKISRSKIIKTITISSVGLLCIVCIFFIWIKKSNHTLKPKSYSLENSDTKSNPLDIFLEQAICYSSRPGVYVDPFTSIESDGNFIYYIKGEDSPYTGYLKDNPEHSDLYGQTLYCFKDGVIREIWEWYKNGKMSLHIIYSDGPRTQTRNFSYFVLRRFYNVSSIEVWSPNGKKCTQSVLENGQGEAYLYDEEKNSTYAIVRFENGSGVRDNFVEEKPAAIKTADYTKKEIKSSSLPESGLDPRSDMAINAAIDSIAEVYPKLSRFEHFKKLEQLGGGSITDYSSARRAHKMVENLKTAAIAAGHEMKEVFDMSEKQQGSSEEIFGAKERFSRVSVPAKRNK